MINNQCLIDVLFKGSSLVHTEQPRDLDRRVGTRTANIRTGYTLFLDSMRSPKPPIDLTKYPIPRVRHHVSPQVYLPETQQHIRPAWYPPVIESLDWGRIFRNGAPPRVLDIGCGRGGFLLEHALHVPDVNILGLEVREVLVDWINSVIDGENVPNARALWYTVANGLQWIDSGSIDYAVYLFPDPWPKKRHHKRRLFSSVFLDELQRILVPQGKLFLATDVEEVDAYQRSVIAHHGRFTISDLDNASWPFPFTTDQQRFCHRKHIPYKLMVATLA